MGGRAPDLGPEMRRVADERVRPGQVVGALVGDRLPEPTVLGQSRGTVLNRQDWGTQTQLAYACYGRSKYGSGRYRVVRG